MEVDQEQSLVFTLEAEDGSSFQVELQQVVTIDGKDYGILVNLADDSCTIMRMIGSEEETTFSVIETDEEFERVSAHLDKLAEQYRQDAEATSREIETLREQGDAKMNDKLFEQASESYLSAWNLVDGDTYGPEDAFWLLMSLADANMRNREFENAMDVLAVAFQNFQELALGNSYFHLRVGQTKYHLDPENDSRQAGSAIDDLARALVCGGIEMFDGEDREFLSMVTSILEPPEGFESWEESRGKFAGMARDRLESASGYPKKIIEERLR